VFKGREAKLNRAIFQALATKSPQTAYGMHKQVTKGKGLKHTRYATVNKRMRNLEELGYIRKVAFKETKAGFEAAIYEITTKAYLAILLNSVDLEKMLVLIDEADATEILVSLLSKTL
jgi:Fe2+ or Zn2+ uptake regulation protein